MDLVWCTKLALKLVIWIVHLGGRRSARLRISMLTAFTQISLQDHFLGNASHLAISYSVSPSPATETTKKSKLKIKASKNVKRDAYLT